MLRISFLAFSLFATALSAGGCATSRHYQDALPHNLTIESRTESVETALDIYSVGKQCEITYLGAVDIDHDPMELGIARGQTSYLVVSFTSASFWSSRSGQISYDFTLLPHEAYRYTIAVSYLNNIYNVAVYEINRVSGEKREMEGVELQNCRS